MLALIPYSIIMACCLFWLISKNTENWGFIIIFLIVLPLINAFFDWVAWALARTYLINSLSSSNDLSGSVAITKDLLVVLTAGLISIPILSILPANSISATNFIITKFGLPEFDWLLRLKFAAYDPWGAGILLSGMLATTLLPVFVHTVVSLSGIFFSWTPNAKELALRIPFNAKAKKQKAMPEVLKEETQRALLRTQFWYVPATIITIAIFACIFEAFSYTIKPYGLFLAGVARCSTAWSHGDCAW
jgi:hypothetical protein